MPIYMIIAAVVCLFAGGIVGFFYGRFFECLYFTRYLERLADLYTHEIESGGDDFPLERSVGRLDTLQDISKILNK